MLFNWYTVLDAPECTQLLLSTCSGPADLTPISKIYDVATHIHREYSQIPSLYPDNAALLPYLLRKTTEAEV
jgi:hypothetical protein